MHPTPIEGEVIPEQIPDCLVSTKCCGINYPDRLPNGRRISKGKISSLSSQRYPHVPNSVAYQCQEESPDVKGDRVQGWWLLMCDKNRGYIAHIYQRDITSNLSPDKTYAICLHRKGPLPYGDILLWKYTDPPVRSHAEIKAEREEYYRNAKVFASLSAASTFGVGSSSNTIPK